MTIEGMDQVLRNLKKLTEGQPDALEEATMAGLLVGERYTKEAAPRKTGYMSRSYTSEIVSKSADEVVGKCGSPIKDPPYPTFVELGTSRMAAQPHLRPGFYNHQSEIKKAVESKLAEKLIGG